MGVVGDRAAPPAPLGEVVAAVGDREQLLGGGAVLRVRGDAQADGQVQRRAVIYLLSDGMNNYGPDGRAEKTAIAAFNAACEKGHIRLATIGYFQSPKDTPPGTNPEEEAGRQLLEDLPVNRNAYFESDNTTDIVRYILSTTTQVILSRSTPYSDARIPLVQTPVVTV